MAAIPKNTEKVPSDVAQWPPWRPKYHGKAKTVIHYPDGRKVNIAKIKDWFGSKPK